MSTDRKLVLAVIDGLKPSMLDRAVADGRAPTLARLIGEGVYIDDCVSAFPSVTPVCAASIATGTGPDRHQIPSMNWFHRGERRYIEYGSSFQASRAFGMHRSLTDTIYNLNLAHMSRDVPTVFESLDDAEVRTAGTTFLIYRGRHRHEVSRETALTRLVTSTLFRHGVYGPRELFYADIFSSRQTGCRGQLGMPGARDQHTGCVGAYLVENDLFDFLLFSLPDNDSHSHRAGPAAQVTSIAAADRQLERLADSAGGMDSFLEDHAVILLGDHSHAHVEQRVTLAAAFAEWGVLRPNDPRPEEAELAVCPAQRSAMLYVLEPDRRAALLPRLVRAARGLEGVDLVAWREGEEAAVAGAGGELRFAPDGPAEDLRGERWAVDGDLGALDLHIQDGLATSEAYPDGLARLWSAVQCSTAGDVLLSAAPGYEFVDWGGVDHVGGGSHGSLHHSDSLGVLIFCGTGPGAASDRRQWTLLDVAPAVRDHFGVAPETPSRDH